MCAHPSNLALYPVTFDYVWEAWVAAKGMGPHLARAPFPSTPCRQELLEQKSGSSVAALAILEAEVKARLAELEASDKVRRRGCPRGRLGALCTSQCPGGRGCCAAKGVPRGCALLPFEPSALASRTRTPWPFHLTPLHHHHSHTLMAPPTVPNTQALEARLVAARETFEQQAKQQAQQLNNKV